MDAKRATRFLIVEDAPFLAERLEEMLARDTTAASDVTIARSVDEATAHLSSGDFDICFLDAQIGGTDSLNILTDVAVSSLLTAVIYFTDTADRRLAYEALKLGVDDLLVKSKFDRFDLEKSVAYALYRKFRQVELQKSTLKDALTGIGNRVLFQEQLKTTIARAERDGDQVGVLYLDIDGFKPVNDTFGHAMGDKLLQAISERLVERTRSSDVVARIGGDEFAAVLVKMDDRDALNLVARNIENAIAAAYEIDSETINIGASVGTALFPEDGNDMTTLIRLADKNMYIAKEQRKGKGRVQDGEQRWS